MQIVIDENSVSLQTFASYIHILIFFQNNKTSYTYPSLIER